MRRLGVGLFVAAVMGGALVGPHAARGQQEPADPGQAKAELPLQRVVMFTSGVGFFERRGDVRGTATVDLRFHVEDINDLLKSLVVQDAGGRVSAINYETRDPVTKTLETFSVDLTGQPTLADLLQQLRGERVEVEAPNRLTGSIVGVETRTKAIEDGKQTVEVQVLNLLADGGLRSFELPSVSSIRFLDEKIQSDFRRALEVLASAHRRDQKTVSLQFVGQNARPVRVGYVQETPVWKTTYRLVLGRDEGPLLQGWAIVENATEEDWNNISLALVSGRPISFRMDLYTPLYVDRPEVQPELYASLRPQVYQQDLDERAKRMDQAAAQHRDRGRLAAKAEARRQFAGEAGAAAPAEEAAELLEFDLGEGVTAVAQGGGVGELFQYQIDLPVTLPRQRSAMLPIVNESVQGEKVSIYNQAVHEKHPLNGVRLTNSTNLHLMQGPITVFDGGAYAGDALIEDLAPGSQRLVSYAMDLHVEVVPRQTQSQQQLVQVRIVRGTLHVTHKYQRTKEFTIKNSGSEAKKVVVEFPIEPEWKLIQPEKADETTRSVYRFYVTAEPGEPARLVVQEERPVSQQFVLSNLNVDQIVLWIKQPQVDDEIKAALQKLVQMKQQLQELQAQRQQLEQQVAVIDQEQARIRKNMEQLDRNSDLYNRYVRKLAEQEDQIEKLRLEIRKLQEAERKLRQAIDEYLTGLTLE